MSCSSSSAKEHDVFLSFRGEDTRVGFTSHLNNALIQKSIKTYVDNKLNRGDDVWPALAKAIEESHVSIVVFSENYATSKWCLKELVKILECRKNNGQIVIPVFYKTDPSHVRKQRGSYEKAFAKQEPADLDSQCSSSEQEVLKWKAANISGWDSRTHEDESQLIENVVNDVLQKLHLRYPTELKGLVGTERNSRNVELLMKKVRVIGIWGMGGIGKSTIAKVLFAKLFPHYDTVCFVANAKEYSLDKLLFELLKEETSRSLGGSTFDMRRLRSKKVFIVLDNVESIEQLEYLCREYSDLSDDSRLIITTRYRQLLVGRVDQIYKVEKWNTEESLKLFSLEAFKQNHPQIGYEDLSQKAVDYAGGVPLALKVLGSYLRSKSTDFWESTFRKLNMYPNETIQQLLEVSYAGLDHLEQKIFLDIAVFFIGQKKDHVISILDACGLEARSGIEVLEDKALITISNSNRIQMHDLLQKTGLEIVRRQCSSNPGCRTRLRDCEACEVIEENKGTDSVEGITLDLSQTKNLTLRADTFIKMKNLRFLRFYIPLGNSCGTTYLGLPAVLEPFSDKLRYFEWIGYPFEFLPLPFCAKLLVEIRMPHSNVKQLWQGVQELDNLEGIDLSECKQFVMLPDLSKASRLKWVNLSGCEGLWYLHPSVLSSDTLVTLILDKCTNLRSVKGEKHLKSLEKISVNGCLKLVEFAVSSDLIENLDLSNTGIQTLDKSIVRMSPNFRGLKLRHLLKELSCITSLKELKLSDSGQVIDKQQLNVLFDGSRSLQVLHLKNCSNLFELPDNINVLSQLQDLRLDGSNLKSLPESINQLEELEILSLKNCKELQCLPELPPFIKLLRVVNCESLESVSNSKTLATMMIGKAKNISYSFKNSLKLDGHSLYGIMESLHLTMVIAAFHNVLVRRLCEAVAVHSYNYTSVEVCVPGRRVPRQIKYRTNESCITIKLPNRSNLLGFIYSVVLSPLDGSGMKKHGTRIKCQCWLAEGTKVTWLNTNISELNSDHVCVWYDPFHCDSILKRYEPKVCFRFYVLNNTGELDCSICIKECGVDLISVTDSLSVLAELDLDSDKKEDLEKGVELESRSTVTLTSIETSDEMESNDRRHQIQNQLRDLSEMRSSDNTDEPDAEIVEPEPAKEDNGWKNHYSIVEEYIKSIQNETKTGVGKEPKSAVVNLDSIEEDNKSKSHFFIGERSMESTSKETDNNSGKSHDENTTSSAKVFRSKGNEVTLTESDAGDLHQLPVVLAVEENAFEGKSSENNHHWQGISEETKHSEENPSIQGGEISAPDTNDLITKEPDQQKENEPMDLTRPEAEEDGSDEDPFAELESILLGSPESSPESACSTSDVAIRETLHNLECLLKNSLGSIHGDVQLQRQLHMSLECIKQASHENISPNVVKLVESMTSSIGNLFKDFSLTKKVVKYHTSSLQQREKLIQRVRDTKKRKESMEKEKSECQDEAKRLKEETKTLDEKIRILVEQKKTVELEKTKMKESMERFDSEKKKLDDEAKNMISESKVLMSLIKNSTSSFDAALLKQQELKDKWECFKTAFADKKSAS